MERVVVLAIAVAAVCLLGIAGRASATADDPPRPKHDLWVWGRNNAGQLGVVDYSDRFEPTLVSLIQGEQVAKIAVGGNDRIESQVLALIGPGKLYATGDNSFGQLGLGDSVDRESLSPIPRLFSADFACACAGESHSAALTKEGEVYVWGSNARGQLGDETFGPQVSLPELLRVSNDSRLVGMSCGLWHTVAWTRDGQVYSWGDNTYGQLGVGNNDGRTQPSRVRSLDGVQVRAVASGDFHTVLLSKNGKLLSWGKNNNGQLGLGAGFRDAFTPKTIPPFSEKSKIVKVAAGYGMSMALTADGKLYGFGDNSGMQLGQHKNRRLPKPTLIRSPASLVFTQVACGKSHCLAINKLGKVFAWGTDTYGQLGLGESKKGTSIQKPEMISKIASHVFTSVVASATGSYAVTEKGELFAWGKNNAGQLGLRSTKKPKYVPEIVIKSNDDAGIVSLSAGGYAFQYESHTAVVLANHDAYTWGWNTFGQLGNSDSEARQGIPTKSAWLAKQKLKAIECGQFTTAAVTEGGELYMWGLNEAGQLGRGEFATSNSDGPRRVVLDGQVASVSIGYGHVLALTKDGRVFSWGKNFYGQLGLGDHRDKSSPQEITHFSDDRIVHIAAGQYHSMALSDTGEVYAWGYNRDHELGLSEDNMDRVLPQHVPDLKGKRISHLAAGGYHSLAISEDGLLYTWGLNNYGQLGRVAENFGRVPALASITTGVTEDKQVGRKLKALKVAAGSWHSLAIGENNQVYAWGRCHFGQIAWDCKDKGYQTFPRHVTQLEDKVVVQIAAGAGMSMAVTKK